MTQQEIEEKEIRNELFEVRMRLGLLKNKKDDPTYEAAYKKAESDLKIIKQKYTKLKFEKALMEQQRVSQGRK